MRSWLLFSDFCGLDFFEKIYYVIYFTIFQTARPKTPKEEAQLNLENQIHGDIVIFNQDDSYETLTVNVFGSFRWALKNCDDFVYMIKIDDDTFIDLDKWEQNLLSHFVTSEKTLASVRNLSFHKVQNIYHQSSTQITVENLIEVRCVF